MGHGATLPPETVFIPVFDFHGDILYHKLHGIYNPQLYSDISLQMLIYQGFPQSATNFVIHVVLHKPTQITGQMV